MENNNQVQTQSINNQVQNGIINNQPMILKDWILTYLLLLIPICRLFNFITYTFLYFFRATVFKIRNNKA